MTQKPKDNSLIGDKIADEDRGAWAEFVYNPGAAIDYSIYEGIFEILNGRNDARAIMGRLVEDLQL